MFKKLLSIFTNRGTGATKRLEGRTLEGHTRRVFALVFSPDGRQLASASKDKSLRLWDVATGAVLQTVDIGSWPSLDDHRLTIAFSPDGHVITFAANNGMLRIWDVATGATLQMLEHPSPVWSVAFSPDSQVVASAAKDGMLRLWDVRTGATLQKLEHTRWPELMAFSPDGKVVASATRDGIIRYWDVATGVARKTLRIPISPITGIALSPNGKLVASTTCNNDCEDGTILLWEVKKGAIRRVLKMTPDPDIYPHPVTFVAFSPDGAMLVSAEGWWMGNTLWDVATGDALHALKGDFTGAFSPDSKLVATTSRKAVWLWETATGALLQKLYGYTRRVNGRCVIFSPNGTVVASVLDKTIRLWDVARV